MLKRTSKALLSASLLFSITALNASEHNSTKEHHQQVKESKAPKEHHKVESKKSVVKATKKEEHSTKETEKKKEPSRAKAETKTKESVERKQESKTKAKKPKKPKLKPLTPEAEKAAYRLFKALKMDKGIRDALIQSLDDHIKQQPSMEPFRDIYVKFFKKYTKWDDMKKELAKIYAQAFSAEEMNKLADFYSSKLGAKSMVVLPRLTQLSMIIAQQRIAKHADELRDEIAKKAKELEDNNEEEDTPAQEQEGE